VGRSLYKQDKFDGRTSMNHGLQSCMIPKKARIDLRWR